MSCNRRLARDSASQASRARPNDSLPSALPMSHANAADQPRLPVRPVASQLRRPFVHPLDATNNQAELDLERRMLPPPRRVPPVPTSVPGPDPVLVPDYALALCLAPTPVAAAARSIASAIQARPSLRPPQKPFDPLHDQSRQDRRPEHADHENQDAAHRVSRMDAIGVTAPILSPSGAAGTALRCEVPTPGSSESGRC